MWINRIKPFARFKQFLSQSGNVNDVTCSSNNIEKSAHILLKLFVMLYSGDTVILAETADDLQNALTQYVLYCDTWKLTINNSKTKVVNQSLLEEDFLIIVSD